jgi:dTDP-4-amino-4,6-dideoxygalactose transaminase
VSPIVERRLIPDHQQSAGPGGSSLPVTEAACAQVLSLPCFPGITDADVDSVINAVRLFYGAAR